MNRLLKPMHKFVKSNNEDNNTVQELKIYNKTIMNLVHENKWQDIINKKLLNLDSHLI